MAKRFHVYISSTKKDLESEREEIQNYFKNICKLTCQDSYSASPEGVLSTCLNDVESAEILILILARKYGSLAKPEEKWSYTQHEFEYAFSRNIPVFAFKKMDCFDEYDQDDARWREFHARVQEVAIPAQFYVRPKSGQSGLRDALEGCREKILERLRFLESTQARQDILSDDLVMKLPSNLAERWSRVKELGEQLTKSVFGADAMAEIVLHAEDLQDGFPSAASLINQLERDLARRVERGWKGMALSGADARESMSVLMRLLFSMAPNENAWNPDVWRHSNGPLPFEDHHLLQAVFSCKEGKIFRFELDGSYSPGGAGNLISPDVLDLTGIEFGVRRRQKLYEEVAKRYGFDYAGLERDEQYRLSQRSLGQLSDHVWNRQDSERAKYVVTEVVANADSVDRDLIDAAEDVSVRAIPRSGNLQNHCLREREGRLKSAVALCLKRISSIP